MDWKKIEFLRIPGDIFLLGSILWTALRWFKVEGLSSHMNLGAPEYAFLLVCFSGALVAINFQWINHLCRPSVRFREIHKPTARTRCYLSGKNYQNEETCWIDIKDIVERLDRLSIPHPRLEAPVLEKQTHWAKFFAWIVVYSKQGALNKARRVAEENNFL